MPIHRKSIARTLKILILILSTAVCIAKADAPSTQPASDDPPMPALMAPSYLAIGKGLSLQLKLVRKTLDDLNLDAATKKPADTMVENCKTNLDSLIRQIQSGNLPPAKIVQAVPQNLK